ncbi:fimbrial protein [Obesumbacterium proteus]|uniref:fimbrial protein n=1 Tax=Obesumbacterium proteus TaxID=82983 RepID=UPI0024316A27|nr:fimbrial protein [Obesumbacterium proteus]
MMNKNAYTLALAFIFPAVLSCSAGAVDNTVINITATVSAAACTTSAPASIPLNFALSASDVAASNANSAWSSDATISLSGCPSTTKSIDAVFSGPAISSDTSGYQMKSSAGTAVTTGSIQLAKSADSTLLTNASGTYNVATASNAATFKVKARMHSITGSVMPDTYTTAIDVTFNYH